MNLSPQVVYERYRAIHAKTRSAVALSVIALIFGIVGVILLGIAIYKFEPQVAGMVHGGYEPQPYEPSPTQAVNIVDQNNYSNSSGANNPPHYQGLSNSFFEEWGGIAGVAIILFIAALFLDLARFIISIQYSIRTGGLPSGDQNRTTILVCGILAAVFCTSFLGLIFNSIADYHARICEKNTKLLVDNPMNNESDHFSI